MQEHESRQNYKKYIKGEERLKNAVVQHPAEDPKTSVYDYLKGQIKRSFWIMSYDKFKKKINNKKD